MPALKEEDSIDEALTNHMNKERLKEIEKFANDNNINFDVLMSIINEYEYSEIFPDDYMATSINAPFLKKTAHPSVLQPYTDRYRNFATKVSLQNIT